MSADSFANLNMLEMSNIFLMSNESSNYFANLLARKLNVPTLGVTQKQFGDGEKYYRILVDDANSLVGKDVVYVNSCVNDDDLLELYRIGCTLACMGTRRRIFVLPYAGYTTMERAVHPGEVVTWKENTRMLSHIPNTGLGNTFLFCDLHVPGTINYFEGASIHVEMSCEKLLRDAVATILPENVVFASADLGRPLIVSNFAEHFGADVAFIQKRRDFEKIKTGNVIGDVSDKNVIIYDDMTRSGGTLLKAAKSYLNNGALSVSVVLSHLALNSEQVVQKLIDSPIKTIVSTNTHPASQWEPVQKSPKFKILDASGLFVSTIFHGNW